MINNPENIPESIFDWLEELDFDSLNSEQKQLVQQHFSKAEYNELHAAIGDVKIGIGASKSHSAPELKSQILQRFDQKYGGKHEFVFRITSIGLWRGAAVILLLISSWLGYKSLRKTEDTSGIALVERDTIYIRSTAGPELEKKKDTIFMVKEVYSIPSTIRRTIPGQAKVSISAIAPSNTDIGVLSIKDLETRSNQPKKNSMRHDTLRTKFGFVSL